MPLAADVELEQDAVAAIVTWGDMHWLLDVLVPEAFVHLPTLYRAVAGAHHARLVELDVDKMTPYERCPCAPWQQWEWRRRHPNDLYESVHYARFPGLDDWAEDRLNNLIRTAHPMRVTAAPVHWSAELCRLAELRALQFAIEAVHESASKGIWPRQRDAEHLRGLLEAV